MSTRTVIETQPDSTREVPRDESERGATRGVGFAEIWLNNHLSSVALAVVAAAFAVRAYVATRAYLNPDEAMHYIFIHQPSAFLAYKASVGIAHPPLLYLLLYYWHLLGSSELMLRMPSVILGTAFCWMLFKWIGNGLGRAAGLIGLTLAAFSPTLIDLSAEVREYALLLFCVAASLYFLERAFREKSVSQILYFTLFLYLAILSHYSAAFFTLAVGVYAVIRISESPFPRKFLVAWACGQVGALAIYAFLYVTQVSKLKDSIAAWGGPYAQNYFHSDSTDIFTFTWENTSKIFLFLFKQPYVSEAIFLLFVAGLAVLFYRSLFSRTDKSQSSRPGMLFVLPFIALWGAALVGKYPFVGSRHTVFLAPFAIATVSFLLAVICRQKLWAGLLCAALLMGGSNASGNSMERGITDENQRLSQMISAVNYMRQSIAPHDLIFMDMQSKFGFQYYFCNRKEIIPVLPLGADYREFTCGGHPVVSVQLWKISPPSFPIEFEKMAQQVGLKSGDRVWVFQNGWGESLDGPLQRRYPEFRCLTPKSFGENLTVIPFLVGPDLSPVAPVKNCEAPIPATAK